MNIIVNLFIFSFSFRLLLIIEMKINNYFNRTFLYTFEYKNQNNQIHFYSRKDENEKKKISLQFYVPM